MVSQGEEYTQILQTEVKKSEQKSTKAMVELKKEMQHRLSEQDTRHTRRTESTNERIDYKACHNHIIYKGMYLIIFALMYTIKVTIEIVLYTPSMTFFTIFTLNPTTPTPSSMV